MNLNTILKAAFFTIILLNVSKASSNERPSNEISLTKQVLKLSDSNNLETINMVSFFGEYTKTQASGFGSVFKWNSKQTIDDFKVSEISASNWKGDSLDILRNITFKIDTANCYSYDNAMRDFGIGKILLSPPNPHDTNPPELQYFGVRNYTWGSVNYFFNRNQCLDFIRFTADPNLLLMLK